MTKKDNPLCISFSNYFKTQNFAIHTRAQSTPKKVFMEISNYMDFQFLIRFLEGLQKFLGITSNHRPRLPQRLRSHDRLRIQLTAKRARRRRFPARQHDPHSSAMISSRSSVRSFPSIPARKRPAFKSCTTHRGRNITKLSDLSA